MAENLNPNDKLRYPVRHTGAFDGEESQLDTTSHDSTETAMGEDWATTANVLNDLISAGFDFITAQKLLAPRVIAGIKSERDYRRKSHRSIKELGHIAGRHLYGGIVHQDNAASMIGEFVGASLTHDGTKIGLELGHIELAGLSMSADEAWRRLDNMAEESVKDLPYDIVDAHHVNPSHRAASFNAIVPENGMSKEVKLPRARTNFPVLDIGKTGIQLFVRVAVGYDQANLQPIELRRVRQSHEVYMRDHSESEGIAMIDDHIFAYPLSATLVALQRNGRQ